MTDNFVGFDAIALGDLIRKKEIKPTELLEIVIQRIEKVNPKLNSVIHKMYDQAREIAEKCDSQFYEEATSDAIFYGVPFLLKDLVAEYNGAPFHEGCRGVKGYISSLDTELVIRQKKAGLIVVGKTNTPEFGNLPTTEPLLSGPTSNPWDPTLTPGGSSGGSAAAVASGMVPMAHGNDGGGSIRVPAACCGVFGLKPTRGRNPFGPLFGDGFSTLAHEHALTMTVRDSAALLDVTSGPDLGDPYWAPPNKRPFLEEVGQDPGQLKIGLLISVPEGWSPDAQLSSDCINAAKNVSQLCEGLGHVVEEISPNDLSYPGFFKEFGTVWSCLLSRFVAYWEEELEKKLTQDQLEPTTWATYQGGLKRSGADYLAALEEIQRFSRKLARWYNDRSYDLILSPTMRIAPTKLGAFEPDPDNPMGWAKMSSLFGAFTCVYNATGQPAMSVPLFWNEDDVPIGVQFAGRFGDEATLFRLASQLEKARPWADRKPTIHVSN